MDITTILFPVWLAFRWLFIALLFYFLFCALDDLFVDLVYYVRTLYRWLFKRHLIRPVTREQLLAEPQKPAAIMIPAWDESAVIGRMLLNTIRTLQYSRYVIFVGAYPNDEATRAEVEKVRELYANVELVVNPANGPTNKADCLNWILQGIRAYEKRHAMRFEMFLMHDSEDVVHPQELLYFNHLMPRFHFIQIPVFPFPTHWYNFANGVYMDEFAEFHTKELRVRELITDCLPSAGVGTVLSREAMDFLASRHSNQVFDVGTLTEDYVMGLSLRDFPGRKIFLQQEVPRDPSARSREPIATREFFPQTFRGSVRQKSRWILGISLQGWRTGWARTLGGNYFLFRDRRALLSNLAVLLGYLVVGFWAASALTNAFVESVNLPPLVAPGEIYTRLIWVILALYLWRILNRIHSSWKIYGAGHAALVIPRVVYGNVLNFQATVAAIARFWRARRSGLAPAWGKTAHAYPTEEQLRGYHRRLGDILLDKRLVKVAELEEALRRQKQGGGKLGDILVGMGRLSPEQLADALRDQAGPAAGATPPPP